MNSKRNMLMPQSPMAEFDSQSVEAAMREGEMEMPMAQMEMPMMGMEMGMGADMGMEDPSMAPDNPLHAVDVPQPSPMDSPAHYNMGLPPAKLNPGDIMASDYQDPRILGDLLTRELQEEATDSEAMQSANVDEAQQDSMQNKKLFGM